MFGSVLEYLFRGNNSIVASYLQRLCDITVLACHVFSTKSFVLAGDCMF